MAREAKPEKRRRVAKIIERLRLAYPESRCELSFSSPLELLIATVLSAQTTDKQVNVVTRDLFRKYPSAAHYAEVPLAELEEDLRRIGLFRNKARNIQACCRRLIELHQGAVPRTMDELTQLGGVGRKTANVVLGNAFQLNEGVVVDTHVARLSGRLGLSRNLPAEKIERDLQELVPRPLWTLFSHLLIWHGRRRCYARHPDCPNCEVNSLCPSAGKIP